MVYQRAVSLFLCRKYRSDISGITTKAHCEPALMGEHHVRIEISDFVMRTFVRTPVSILQKEKAQIRLDLRFRYIIFIFCVALQRLSAPLRLLACEESAARGAPAPFR